MSEIFPDPINPADYDTQLTEKKDRLNTLFAEFAPPTLEVYDSPRSHYRLRAEFRLWHEGERCFYAMFEPGNRSKAYEVREFNIASTLINDLMGRLLAEIHASELLRRSLFQVEFLTTLSGDALITIIYHKKLDEAWEAEARAMQARLGFPVIGRSRKQKIVLERDYVTETLTVDGKQFHYRQIEGGFTIMQPSGKQMSIYDAAMSYQKSKIPTVVFGGEEYGTGSSRDWAAKGTQLLGVRAVIAKSFERIHRSNLVGMGVLPLQFKENDSVEKLGITGNETYEILGMDSLKPQQDMILVVTAKDGKKRKVTLLSRIDTSIEVDYFKHGGILPYVLRELLDAA